MAITYFIKSTVFSNPIGLAVTGIASVAAVVGLAMTEPDATSRSEARQSSEMESVVSKEKVQTPTDRSRVQTVSRTQDLELHWDPSNDAVGYRVYWGTTPTEYDGVEDVGNVLAAIVSDLDSTKQYHFAITAYSRDGSESAPTNEVQTP
jgi:hypothetical protein